MLSYVASASLSILNLCKFVATSHLTATLVQEVPADSGNFLRYMTDSTAVLEDSYSEVVVNVIDLALNWQLFSDVGRPRSFVNVMSMNSTLNPVSTVLCRMLL